MCRISARPDFRRQAREIKNESNQRSHVLHAQRGVQPGIDREKLNLNGGLICQAAQQLVGLNGLTADDIERRCDQENADGTSRWGGNPARGEFRGSPSPKQLGFVFSIALPLLLVRSLLLPKGALAVLAECCAAFDRLSSVDEAIDFGGSQFAIAADGKIADAQVADCDADQLQHFASDGLDHAAHLPVAAFVNGDFDE